MLTTYIQTQHENKGLDNKLQRGLYESSPKLVCLRVWYLKTLCIVYCISLDKISGLKVSLNTWFDVSFVSKRNKELVSIDCWYRTPHNFV